MTSMQDGEDVAMTGRSGLHRARCSLRTLLCAEHGVKRWQISSACSFCSHCAGSQLCCDHFKRYRLEKETGQLSPHQSANCLHSEDNCIRAPWPPVGAFYAASTTRLPGLILPPAAVSSGSRILRVLKHIYITKLALAHNRATPGGANRTLVVSQI